MSSRELKWGGIYIYFISVLCTITAESSTTDLATTHLTSLARDIFWSQKSQLYIVNSYSWEILFSQNISLALPVIWVVASSLVAPHSNNTAELIALRISVNFCLANSSPYIGIFWEKRISQEYEFTTR